uniref:FYVE-type domain-containing protein n=1 Tax=Neobodo designis TaxID=312471 RepID=A0A7S1R5E3_NEODS
MSEQRKTIRFEDLGEPVQKLLKALHKGKGEKGVSDEDMSLLEYIAVRDMVKIYQEMGADDGRAEEIWNELKTALIARREKADRKRRELEERAKDIESERTAAEEEAARLQAEHDAEAEAAEKRRRKEERRKRRAAEAAAAAAEEERAALEAAEAEAEAQRAEEEAAEEEARQRRENRRKRREEKARRLAEEAAALEQEQVAAREERKRKRNQKSEWDNYVATHPLEFQSAAPTAIEQQRRDDIGQMGRAALADDGLLNRIYTPQCPNCHAKYSKPPAEWDCPMCLRKFRQHVKCWQPDDTSNCGCCNCSVGRFTRHHCRSCGRIVCGKCSDFKVEIPSIGFKGTPVRACKQCLSQLAPHVLEAAQAKK